MAYRFRLQSVLRLREEREQERKLALAAALRAARVEQAALAGVIGESTERVSDLSDEIARPEVDVAEVTRCLDYITLLAQRADERRQALAELNDQADGLRGELVDAMRARRVIESLRERDRRRHDAELLHAEQRLLDELSTVRFAGEVRRRSAGPAAPPFQVEEASA